MGLGLGGGREARVAGALRAFPHATTTQPHSHHSSVTPSPTVCGGAAASASEPRARRVP